VSKSRFGEVGVYASVIMTIILATQLSIYAHFLSEVRQQQSYFPEIQQIDALRRAENIHIKYEVRENAVYARPTVRTSIKSLVVYGPENVAHSNPVDIELSPLTWTKVVEGDLVRLLIEGNYVLGLITENGNLITWIPQQAIFSNSIATLLPAVRYQSFLNDHPRYVGLVTSASPSGSVCDAALGTECVGVLNASFPNERKVIINAPALYADLVGVYAWVEGPVNISLKIVFAENNFDNPVNLTLDYLLLPHNSRVEDVVTYSYHVNSSKTVTQPLKKVVVKEYVRKTVLVDSVSLVISDSVTRAGVLIILAFTLSLPSGQYPQNPTIMLDIELLGVRVP